MWKIPTDSDSEADTRIRDMKKNPCRLSGTRPSAQATSRKLRGRVQVAQHGGPRTTGGRLVPVRLSELAVTSRVMCCTSSPRGLPIAARARPSLPSLGGRHGRSADRCRTGLEGGRHRLQMGPRRRVCRAAGLCRRGLDLSHPRGWRGIKWRIARGIIQQSYSCCTPL